jgi:glutamate:GABA antiporter
MSKKITVFTLAMINVAAVSSIRNWPTIAEYGFSSLFFFFVAALIFLIPVAMVSAELATGWPKIGGVFAWVKEAFGHRIGFLAVWLLWAENVIYYPTLLSFIAGTIAYVIDPALADHSLYTLSIVIGVFWLATFANLWGMKASGWISTVGVIVGTMIPGGFIIGLGVFWYMSGCAVHISLDLPSLIPDVTPTQLAFFSGVLTALGGLEMSAVHARDVDSPQKNYPRAILLSALLILGLYVLGVLAIALVVPQSEISLVAGSIQAFSIFVHSYGLDFLTPVIACLLVLGALGTLSTWIAGPSKGLLAAAQSGDLPKVFQKVNHHGMPVPLLLAQAAIVSVVSLIFFVMPSISSAYWILNALVAQLYLLMYILLFAAAIYLRYSKPEVERAYKVPGGVVGMWVVAGTGLLGSFCTFIIGFFPPAQIAVGNKVFYILFLLLAILLACFIPSCILFFKNASWRKGK